MYGYESNVIARGDENGWVNNLREVKFIALMQTVNDVYHVVNPVPPTYTWRNTVYGVCNCKNTCIKMKTA
jgi:hypothetical protein